MRITLNRRHADMARFGDVFLFVLEGDDSEYSWMYTCRSGSRVRIISSPEPVWCMYRQKDVFMYHAVFLDHAMVVGIVFSDDLRPLHEMTG